MYYKVVTKLEKSSPLRRGQSNKIVVIGKSVIVVNRVVIESSLVIGDDLIGFSFQEKLHYDGRKACQNTYFSVPQTDTGGLVE